jgi:hypothetical protein
MEDALSKMKFYRKERTCKNKWEVMVTNFWKVYDHDNLLGSGIILYYMMTEREKGPKAFTKPFFKKVF